MSRLQDCTLWRNYSGGPISDGAEMLVLYDGRRRGVTSESRKLAVRGAITIYRTLLIIADQFVCAIL